MKSSTLGIEAGEWLLNLEDPEGDDAHPYPDPAERQAAFLRWVTRSPEHARVFLETAETWRRLARLDQQRLIDIRRLMDNRAAEVIPLYLHGKDAGLPVFRTHRPRARLWWSAGAAAAAASILAAVIFLMPDTYSTAVGRHETRVLPDGSIVYLNTDSRVRVDFSRQRRQIDLLRGEALFIVAKDASRPFVVGTQDASIQAVGTQFNVRQRTRSTDIAVVEGAVQVRTQDPSDAAQSLRLKAGQEADVTGGAIRMNLNPAVADAIAWREWRLVFRDTPLAEVAEEFNRYNRGHIRIVGARARTRLMTGVFDADRPESLIAYVQGDETLTVRTEGEDWVIGERG